MHTKRLCILLFLAAGFTWAQVNPDCQFTLSFTAATPQAPAFSNKPTTTTGPACTSWIVSYWTTGASGVSVQIEGAPDPGTGIPPTTGFTALTGAGDKRESGHGHGSRQHLGMLRLLPLDQNQPHGIHRHVAENDGEGVRVQGHFPGGFRRWWGRPSHGASRRRPGRVVPGPYGSEPFERLEWFAGKCGTDECCYDGERANLHAWQHVHSYGGSVRIGER